MNKSIAILILFLSCVICRAATTAPSADPVAAYRDYVAAVRAGSAEKALKLVEPVPDSTKPLLQATVEMHILIEAVKAEIDKQFHPPEPEHGHAILGELPADWLKDVIPERINSSTVRLVLKDPKDSELKAVVGFMVRQNGNWLMAANVVLQYEDTPTFVEPRAEIIDALTKVNNAWTAAAKTVLQKLQNKEFQSAAEARKALNSEFARAISQPDAPAHTVTQPTTR